MKGSLRGALPAAARAILLMAFGACSRDAGYQGAARVPDPPANPGSLEMLTNTVWETPGGTLTFLQPGQARFKPKQAPSELVGTYSLDNGIAFVIITGVEPIAAVWDGVKLVIQGVECSYAGKAELPSASAGEPGNA